jgi:Ca2+-binding RTX toxin-like protein
VSIFDCNSTASLIHTLSVARAGDTIRLASGNYGEVRLDGLRVAGGLAITSADPAHPAVLTYLSLTNCQGLTFADLEFNIRTGHLGVYANASSDIRLEHLDIHGVVDGDPTTDGTGVSIRDSSGVLIANSEFHDLGAGVGLLNAHGLIVVGNQFHHIRSDGISGTASNDLLISGNHFRDFFPAADDHPDVVQLWTSASRATRNVMIADNVFERGAGRVVQGIFLKPDGIGFENVSITGNAIVGGMYQGISVTGAHGVTVADNLVLGYADMTSWIMLKDSSDASLYDNRSTSYITGAGTVTSGNLPLVQAMLGDSTVLQTWSQRPTPAGTVVVWGSDAADSLMGRAGSQYLSGGAGADTMAGGAGDDIYVVDDSGDVVIELAGGGVDTIRSLAPRLSLSDDRFTHEVENLTLAGTGPQAGTGNALDNILSANASSSTLSGGAGNDILLSVGGADVLAGGSGSDQFAFRALPSQIARITDFNILEDRIDLRQLLPAYSGQDPVMDRWIAFGLDAQIGVRVYIDTDGPAGPRGWQPIVDLTGLDARALSSDDWII